MQIRDITPIDYSFIEQKKRNVCAYARVSTSKDVAIMSFDTQIHAYTTMIKENPNWNFVGVYSDEGKSGTNLEKRSQFKFMLDIAKSGLIDLIITKSISRFSRNVVDTITILQDLKKSNVEVWFENENISSFDPKIEFVISVLSGMAEEEARNVSENVKWNVRKRFAEGKFYVVAKGFLGYENDSKGNLIINEDQANVVRSIYDKYTNGVGVTSIIKWLNDSNIQTTYQKGKWYPNAVYNILKNEKYTGNAILQKTYRPSFKSKTRVINENKLPKYLVENAHSPIISIETFELAQNIRFKHITQYHAENHVINKDKYNKSSKYAGLVKCPYCAKNYIQRTGRKGALYSEKVLICSSNKNHITCPAESISLLIFERAIKNQIEIILKHKKEFLDSVYKGLVNNTQVINANHELEATKEKLLALESKRDYLKRLEDDYHRTLLKEINGEIDNVLIKKNDWENKLAVELNINFYYDRIKAAIMNFKKDDDEIVLFKNLFSKVIPRNRNQFTFHLKTLETDDSMVVTHFKGTVDYYIRKRKNSLEHGIVL
ncbi:MAG: recombinase family protein [Bacillota bacterium]